MAGCPDLCLCGFDNTLGRGGVEVEGAGTPSDPFYVQPSDGNTIPMTGTHGDRVSLVLAAADIGTTYYEVDTGLTYQWQGASWVLLTSDAYTNALDSVAITSAPDGTWQDFLSTDLAPGWWVISVKGNIEANIDGETHWTFRLLTFEDSLGEGAGVVRDLAATNATSDLLPGFSTIMRAWSLLDLCHLTDPVTHAMVSVGRDNATGAQLVRHAKIVAHRVMMR